MKPNLPEGITAPRPNVSDDDLRRMDVLRAIAFAGGDGGGSAPSNALVTDDSTPIVTDGGDYILVV